MELQIMAAAKKLSYSNWRAKKKVKLKVQFLFNKYHCHTNCKSETAAWDWNSVL